MKTKLIEIRYLFIHDIIRKEKGKHFYVLTNNQHVDFFTKELDK